MLRRFVPLAVLCLASPLRAADAPELRPTQQAAVAAIEARRDEIVAANRAIWEFAEVGLQERKSSALLADRLKAAGFRVTTGVADLPTAFVAEYGSGKPVVGILAEYDALPGMSQKAEPHREPVVEGAAGHACGHSGLGAAAVGAALAVRDVMAERGLGGTVRLYGTPAEETGIGKAYMQLAGVFDDLDACLHWHPSNKNEVFWEASTKAYVSAKFTFAGTAAHASMAPEKGRSALDAVELMNIGVNFFREHVKEDARLHYVITDGGGQPNVVPAKAEVWYYVRADRHEDVERYFERVREIAEGAALMTRTKVAVRVDTDNHEIIENKPLAELLLRNMKAVGPPTFDEAERAFARRCQEPLTQEFGTVFPVPFEEDVRPLTANRVGKGSTDVGDVSWHVPTGGFLATCFPAEAPGHSWQNVASIGTSIGEKGTVYAAKVLAVTAVDLFERPDLVAAAKADLAARMKGRAYTTLIPKGQKPPASIR